MSFIVKKTLIFQRITYLLRKKLKSAKNNVSQVISSSWKFPCFPISLLSLPSRHFWEKSNWKLTFLQRLNKLRTLLKKIWHALIIFPVNLRSPNCFNGCNIFDYVLCTLIPEPWFCFDPLKMMLSVPKNKKHQLHLLFALLNTYFRTKSI